LPDLRQNNLVLPEFVLSLICLQELPGFEAALARVGFNDITKALITEIASVRFMRLIEAPENMINKHLI
jgi:hypothetical protein